MKLAYIYACVDCSLVPRLPQHLSRIHTVHSMQQNAGDSMRQKAGEEPGNDTVCDKKLREEPGNDTVCDKKLWEEPAWERGYIDCMVDIGALARW